MTRGLGRRMAEESDARVLQLLRNSRQHRSLERLRSTAAAVVAVDPEPPQSTWPGSVGSVDPALSALDSSTPRSPSLSLRTLRRKPSKGGAVRIKVLVRLCAGGDQ